MSYVDEVLERVVAKNPAEPEFHQAVKEVLESLRPVIEANEETYRREALLERLTEPDRQFKFRVDRYRSIQGTAYSLITALGHTRAACASIRP